MTKHGFVEVDPAQALDPVRQTDDLESILGASHHGYVERSATEVVDDYEIAGLDSLLVRIRDRGRDRFTQESNTGKSRALARLLQHVKLERAPVRRMCDRHSIGWFA